MLNQSLFTSNKHNWQTPTWLFKTLNDHFEFKIDVCADDNNYLCKKYFTENNSCLNHSWSNINFMNPPYGRSIKKFIKKAHYEWQENNYTTVGLLPARTCTKWFHKYVYNQANIIFIKGRLKFEGGKQLAGAPFPSMVAIWWGDLIYNEKKFLTDQKLFNLIEEGKINNGMYNKI